MHRLILVFLYLCGMMLCSQAQSLDLRVNGDEATLFSALRDACDRGDYPDTPARAFRDQEGLIHLFATHMVNRASVGRSWQALKRDCRVAYRGRQDDDPAKFDDRSWLATFYRMHDNVVHAIVHNEYHGNLRPEKCPSRQYSRCWYNTLTYVRSLDGGYTFARLPGPYLVAAPPVPYVPDAGGRRGASSPSNIVEVNGNFYFMFVSDLAHAGGQICLARSNDLSDPTSWKGWGGQDFDVIFRDPFTATQNELLRKCEPIRGLISGSIGSLGHHKRSGLFILTQEAAGSSNSKSGVYYSTSRDLIHWSAPSLLLEVPTYNPICNTLATYSYPSLIDPKASDDNFTSLGAQVWLFLSKNFINEKCGLDWRRDLVFYPVYIELK